MTRIEQHVADAKREASAYSSIHQAAAAGTSFGQLLAAGAATWGRENGQGEGTHESDLVDAFANAIAQAEPGSCTHVFLDAAYSSLSAGLRGSRT